MKTFVMNPADIKRKWYLVDAKDLVLGRLAVNVANILRGKNKPFYSPHMDCGDYVIVVNADKIHLTGKKYMDKRYYYHTGYPGGIVERSVKQICEGKNPQNVVVKAVERMMSRNTLGRNVMSKLKVYVGENHPHAAQNPEVLDIAAMNSKNSKR